MVTVFKSKLSTTKGYQMELQTLFSNMFPEHLLPRQSLVSKQIVPPPNSHHWASVAMSGCSGYSNKQSNVLIFTDHHEGLHLLQHYYLFLVLKCIHIK